MNAAMAMRKEKKKEIGENKKKQKRAASEKCLSLHSSGFCVNCIGCVCGLVCVRLLCVHMLCVHLQYRGPLRT